MSYGFVVNSDIHSTKENKGQAIYFPYKLQLIGIFLKQTCGDFNRVHAKTARIEVLAMNWKVVTEKTYYFY